MKAEEAYLYCGKKDSGRFHDRVNGLFYPQNKHKLETGISCFRISHGLKTK